MKVAGVALVTCLLAMTLLAPVVTGGDGSDSEFEDEFEGASRRVEVNLAEGEVEVGSVGVEGDRIRMSLRADEAELRFDFTTAETNMTEVQMELEFESILEFADDNGDGAFDKDDTIIQKFDVQDMVFSNPVIEQVSDGIRIDLSYEASGMTLGLVFWVFGNETLVNGTLVRPTEVKFDIHVNNFPFQAEDSLMAIVIDLKTEVEPELNANATMETLQAASERFQGFFRWSTAAVVDGGTVRVNSTVLEVETEVGSEFEVERRVALTYPQGSAVVHDPWIGVAMAPAPQGMDPLVLMGFLAAVIVGSVVIAALLARRRGEV